MHETCLYLDLRDGQLPIVYRNEYNIKFLGMEKLHPFDSGKWGNVFQFLLEAEFLHNDNIIHPKEAETKDLLIVHTERYLNSLKWSANVARITEVPPVLFLPNFLVQKAVLKPMRYQTGGSILAGKLAIDHGWAINIGGGFHHCSSDHGGGFCVYADISLTIKFLFEKFPSVKSAMIVDLDAHQGNGHERDFMDDQRVYILDVYNRGIYPQDHHAKKAIRRKVELRHFTEDDEYLERVTTHLEGALNEFRPDFLLYNAGTDILEGDRLGLLSVSANGIIQRDELVFTQAKRRKIPILMLTSGGYQRKTARIIADSILNLKEKNLIYGLNEVPSSL